MQLCTHIQIFLYAAIWRQYRVSNFKPRIFRFSAHVLCDFLSNVYSWRCVFSYDNGQCDAHPAGIAVTRSSHCFYFQLLLVLAKISLKCSRKTLSFKKIHNKTMLSIYLQSTQPSQNEEIITYTVAQLGQQQLGTSIMTEQKDAHLFVGNFWTDRCTNKLHGSCPVVTKDGTQFSPSSTRTRATSCA